MGGVLAHTISSLSLSRSLHDAHGDLLLQRCLSAGVAQLRESFQTCHTMGEASTPRHLSTTTEFRAQAREPLAYRLSPKNFPSWPPKSVSEEERAWYKLAIHDRKQKKSTLVNQIRDSKLPGGSISGLSSPDHDSAVGHRNVAARGISVNGLVEMTR